MNDKYGPKWLATSGFIIATPFLICLRFVSEDSLNHKIMMCGLLVGVGLAVALVFGPLMAEISWSAVDGMDPTQDDMSAVPYAQAYGLYNMAFSGGCMLGPILGGLIRDRAGWPTVCWVLGLITAASTITQALWIGGPLKLKLPGRAGESS
jgi:MFS family permease